MSKQMHSQWCILLELLLFSFAFPLTLCHRNCFAKLKFFHTAPIFFTHDDFFLHISSKLTMGTSL